MAFEPPDGGVPEQVRMLATGLRSRGWEVEVAGPPKANIYERLGAREIPVHRIPSLGRGYGQPWRDAAALRQLGGLIRAGSFRVVHCHAAKAGVIGRAAARRAGVRAVYSPHCFGFVGDVNPLRRAAVAEAERVLGRRTDALVCVCDAELEEARARGICPPDRRWRVHNACEPCEPPAAPGPAVPRVNSGPVVGAISVMRPQKALDVLVRAAPKILASRPDTSIAIIGDGPLRPRLEAEAGALGLTAESRFRFLPFSPPSSRYLRELDLFVLPSAWEALPISLLEALACGVPQVATDVGGVREAVTPETGVIVPPRSPDELAHAVIEVLGDETLRRNMERASIARHRESFRPERMVAETARIYETLIGDR